MSSYSLFCDFVIFTTVAFIILLNEEQKSGCIWSKFQRELSDKFILLHKSHLFALIVKNVIHVKIYFKLSKILLYWYIRRIKVNNGIIQQKVQRSLSNYNLNYNFSMHLSDELKKKPLNKKKNLIMQHKILHKLKLTADMVVYLSIYLSISSKSDMTEVSKKPLKYLFT